ncbi:MAG: DDE-type integrase/transposase/recombinase [Planctomycetota bacterium]|jgi:transposase InsO family protein
MTPSKRPGKRQPPVDGRPCKGGREETGKPTPSPAKKKRKKRAKKTKRRLYTPEEKRAAIEAYQKSGMTLVDFSATWGVSKATLTNWLRKHQAEGPKGLERKPHAGKGKSRLAAALRGEIVRAKRYFPDFGLKKLRDYLYRFRGVKVSPGAIKNTLNAEAVPIPPPPKRKKRKKKKPARRFERAKPGALWQSDITSFVLTRHSTRVYLTVFLDDFSRYIVSFTLALHQKQDLVTEALLSGISRFGKPKEVLTDQGRQYFAWRGKSGFQKLLEKQGIRHVVARSHHPQTVGKCERFWKTVQEEFWSRAQPQELEEARERLTHFIAHYNHHRPHQGIDGLVPADRFFGAQDAVRDELEAQHAENELLLALDHEPRRPVYLVGRIGERSVSMHGERGKLVINGPDGDLQALDPEHLGMPKEEISHERIDREDGKAAGALEYRRNLDDPGIPDPSPEEAETIDGPTPQESVLQDAETRTGTGEGAMGVGGGGGETESTPGRGSDPGDVAGPGEPERGGGPSGGTASSRVAAISASALGPGDGPFEAAEEPGENREGGRATIALETAGENRQAGARGGEPSPPGGSLKGLSDTPGENQGEGGGSCPIQHDENPSPPEASEEQSERDCWKKTRKKANEWPWLEHTE